MLETHGMTEKRAAVTNLKVQPFESIADFTALWNKVDLLSLPAKKDTRYVAGFANSDRCIEEALRLRYEVFNIELNEGLSASALTGLDRDEFDEQMTHLVLMDREAGGIVGTYRMQAVKRGLKHKGIYSAQEYDLASLEPLFDEAIECGRACVAMGHRSLPAMLTMWLGIGAYMNLYGLHYLFGCCSLTTRDPLDGWRAMKTIRENDYLHKSVFVPVREEYCCGPSSLEFGPETGDSIPLPKLFRTYMRLGMKVISEPALDRAFGTVDFLVLMDGREVALSGLDVLK
jgi:putative hemolysin